VKVPATRGAEADVTEGQVGPVTVSDGVEGEHGLLGGWLVLPTPGEADVLRRVEREDRPRRQSVPQSQTQGTAQARLELGLVRPLPQSLRSRDQPEDALARRFDLSLELDPVVDAHGPGGQTALTAVTSWASPSLASAKSMPVLGFV
jgi:hypothetical protein